MEMTQQRLQAVKWIGIDSLPPALTGDFHLPPNHPDLKPGIHAQHMVPGTVQIGAGQQHHGSRQKTEPGGKLLERLRQVNGFLPEPRQSG